MTSTQALFIVDVLGVICGCYTRVARPARWSVRIEDDGALVTNVYEVLA